MWRIEKRGWNEVDGDNKYIFQRGFCCYFEYKWDKIKSWGKERYIHWISFRHTKQQTLNIVEKFRGIYGLAKFE